MPSRLGRVVQVVPRDSGPGERAEEENDKKKKKKRRRRELTFDWCTRLEIGAGGGLVGLAVANGCSLSQPLHITDQLEMLTLMGHNVVLNNAQGRVKPSILSW